MPNQNLIECIPSYCQRTCLIAESVKFQFVEVTDGSLSYSLTPFEFVIYIWSFVLFHVFKGRHYFAAETVPEMKEWVSAISSAMKSHIRVKEKRTKRDGSLTPGQTKVYTNFMHFNMCSSYWPFNLKQTMSHLFNCDCIKSFILNFQDFLYY